MSSILSASIDDPARARARDLTISKYDVSVECTRQALICDVTNVYSGYSLHIAVVR